MASLKHFLGGLIGLSWFGFVVGALTGMVVYFVVLLGSIVLTSGAHASVTSIPEMLVGIVLIGGLAGGLVGVPFGWMTGLVRNRFGAAIAGAALMGVWLYVFAEIVALLSFPEARYGTGIIIGAAVTSSFLVFSVKQNRLSYAYRVGVKNLYRGLPRSQSARLLLGGTLVLSIAGLGLTARCHRYANGELHQLNTSNEVLRLLVERYDEPNCLCPRPVGPLSFQRNPSQGFGNDWREGRVNYVMYVPNDSLLLTAHDPSSGWTTIWDSLSIVDLRQLAASGATFDTLTRRGYPTATRRAYLLNKSVPLPF